ncbi:MAG TPA: ribonuclease HI family protein [Candidatus Krumholzibacteria bacterium]|nr:ribonuclease HI family protein [Candidatus Krumholzibacteria bacterium]HRX50201.1 ribonuclease HI family protein [Candidatus Krumholzibacteria bacterium]
MTEAEKPTTLGELLLHLERSDNLRTLARQCGMAPGDLRRSLKRWRKELETGETEADAPETDAPRAADAEPAASRPAAVAGVPEALAGLSACVDLTPADLQDHPQLHVWTDGASRGNPGPASIGVLFALPEGELLCAHAETIGKATNNVAEYRAVLRALQFASAWKLSRLTLHLDSELIARQLTGQYRVKSPDLLPYYRQVVSLSQDLDRFLVRHVRRAQNSHADALANLALDGKGAAFGA